MSVPRPAAFSSDIFAPTLYLLPAPIGISEGECICIISDRIFHGHTPHYRRLANAWYRSDCELLEQSIKVLFDWVYLVASAAVVSGGQMNYKFYMYLMKLAVSGAGFCPHRVEMVGECIDRLFVDANDILALPGPELFPDHLAAAAVLGPLLRGSAASTILKAIVKEKQERE